MGNLTKRVVKIHIPSELGYEKIPISAVAIIARKAGITHEVVENLKMAVGEAVTNAIEHGNQLIMSAIVSITFTIDSEALIVNVKDQGHRPIPNIPEVRKEREDHRGWGMWLIKDLMDDVSVSADSDGNEVKMILYLQEVR